MKFMRIKIYVLMTCISRYLLVPSPLGGRPPSRLCDKQRYINDTYAGTSGASLVAYLMK